MSLEQLEHARLDSILILALERIVAHEHVEVLTLDDFGTRLFHLLLRKMNQKVRHAEYGVARLLANANLHDAAVLLRHDAVHRQRQRNPLVLLDAAVIMRIEVGEAAVLIERVLLDIEAAGINMRPEDVHALGEWLVADIEERQRLLHIHRVDFIARLQLLPCSHDVCEVAVAHRLSLLHGLPDALALRLARAQELPVARTERLERLFFLFAVLIPDRNFLFFFCHNDRSFLVFMNGCLTAPVLNT